MYVRRHIVRNNFHDPAVRDKGGRERHYYCATAGGPADSPDRFTNARARANRGKACKDARIHTHTREWKHFWDFMTRKQMSRAQQRFTVVVFFFFEKYNTAPEPNGLQRHIANSFFFPNAFRSFAARPTIVTFTARLTLPCGRESIRRRDLQRIILRRVPEKITNSFRSRRFKTTRPINDRSWK